VIDEMHRAPGQPVVRKYSVRRRNDRDSAAASDRAKPIDARHHRASVMASTMFGLVVDAPQFVAVGLRSRLRLAPTVSFPRTAVAGLD
jgi:hypothetical protein